MELGATYRRGVDYIDEGTTYTWDRRPVSFRALVQRRWGWPKKAAHAAADLIRDDARARGDVPRLWVANPKMNQQQGWVFLLRPSLLDDLMTGLARGSSKEVEDADHVLHSVMIEFDQPISDDGLVRDFTNVLANRLGAAPDDVRAATFYDTGRPDVLMRVRSSVFECDK